MLGEALLVADKAGPTVIQEGQPPAQMGAWLLPYDTDQGQSAASVAADFASQTGFPIGTVARLIDLSASPITEAIFQLTSQWVAYTPPEGV